MDPTTLIGPTSALGYPAPFWFVLLFKVLGFTLHMVPMNLWYAGLILAALIHLIGGEHGRRVATRLVSAMPIIVALGINLGIIPLLFMQVGFYQVFYPATILMAWPWFSIFGLLIIAYYGVYIYVSGLRDKPDRFTPLKRIVGWIASLVFIVIGFLFANGMSLMANVEGWEAIAKSSGQAGAVTGLALNLGDPTLWPRWLMMFGLALTTTAAYVIVDTVFFAVSEKPGYKEWATRLAATAYSVGLVWFEATAIWYVGTLQASVRDALLSGPALILAILTALAPIAPWLLIFVQRKGVTRSLAVWTGLAQFVLLALFAISRQFIQSTKLAEVMQLGAEPVNTQWSPLVLFLVLFMAGLGVVAWMLQKVISETRTASG